jgi:hypothetical protein
MCKPQDQGGQRCAAHTRKALAVAVEKHEKAGTPASYDALMAARAEHASTPSGRKEFLKALAEPGVTGGTRAALETALDRGARLRDKNQAVRDAVRAAAPTQAAAPAGAEPLPGPVEAMGLVPGSRFSQQGINTTVLGQREPFRDPFGREMFQVMARREDTGAEGWVRFGPDGSFSPPIPVGVPAGYEAADPSIEFDLDFPDGVGNDPHEMPAFSGTAERAHRTLIPGTYDGTAHDGWPVRVVIGADGATAYRKQFPAGVDVDSPEFQYAVKTAQSNLPIKKAMTREEYWDDYRIVRKSNGRMAVYDAGAWEKPSEQPMLPWSPPTGEIVATVTLGGDVVPY